jgi:HK97 family phage prohead protease
MTTTIDVERLLEAPEHRSVAIDDFEVRADGDSLELAGYASVFDAPYDVYGGPERGGFTEVVDPDAFSRTLKEKPDVHLLINHEGMPLARTKSGTLQLATDNTGLKVNASLDRRDPDVQRLQTKMDRGDMDEMSFAFRTIRHEWNDDETERRMLEVSIHKGDVSVVNFGANPATSVKLRSLDAALQALLDVEFDDVLVEARSLTDANKLAEAHRLIGRVLREVTPADQRTLTLTEARALLAS